MITEVRISGSFWILNFIFVLREKKYKNILHSFLIKPSWRREDFAVLGTSTVRKFPLKKPCAEAYTGQMYVGTLNVHVRLQKRAWVRRCALQYHFLGLITTAKETIIIELTFFLFFIFYNVRFLRNFVEMRRVFFFVRFYERNLAIWFSTRRFRLFTATLLTESVFNVM